LTRWVRRYLPRAAASLVRALRGTRGSLLCTTGTSHYWGPFCTPIGGPDSMLIDTIERSKKVHLSVLPLRQAVRARGQTRSRLH
jgi:hypothetical protein